MRKCQGIFQVVQPWCRHVYAWPHYAEQRRNFVVTSPTRQDDKQHRPVLLVESSQQQQEPFNLEDDEVNRISVLYFHHIYNPKKRAAVKEFAVRRDLSGIYLFGKPGRVLVEGSLENVEEYVKAIKRLRWQYVAVKETLERRRRRGEGRLFEGFVNVMTDKDFGNAMRQVGLGDTFQRLFDKCPSTNGPVTAGGLIEGRLGGVTPIRRPRIR
eukprot:GHVS01069483.1.p1 GENE.GHVS01069483.1~~GHVS01069483.1.p1  ORF type:complete len:212 (-),score=32.37 GHVS01069483.1:450-1085(-)